MRKFQLVLAYYTLIISCGLFFWSILLGPKPYGLLLAVLIIPVGIYFWIIILGRSKIKAVEYPKEAKSEEQLTKVSLTILFTLLISSLSMFAFAFINTKFLSPSNDIPSSVSSRLSLIEQEMENLNNDKIESTDKILGALEEIKNNSVSEDEETADEIISKIEKEKLLGASDTNLEAVTIRSKENNKVNVYKEKNSSSDVVGQAVYGEKYTFLDKEQDWYLILFTDKKDTVEGYINSQFVKEVEY